MIKSGLLKLSDTAVRFYKQISHIFSKYKQIIAPVIFYVLLLLNLAFFGPYHNIFIYNAKEYSFPNLVTLFPSSYICLVMKLITLANWLFGFAFLPATIHLISSFKKAEYTQFLNMLFNVIALDIILSLINKGGAIGSISAYYVSWPFLLSSSIALLSVSNFFAFRRKQKIKTTITRIRTAPVMQQSSLPSINLLTIGEKIAISSNIEEQKKTLMQTLKDFGISAKIVDVVVGPVVTLYSVELAAGIKSIRLINLDEDIARSMQAFSTRISTIPGKNLMGIEVANKKRQTVYFKEGLKSDKYNQFDGNLPLYLGANIYGEHEVFDLSQMPHLLVAGTTGSGKSVGLHTMLLSILYKKLPNELKLILIDPKKLELTPYEDIPHLLLPIVTEPKQAVSSLKWVVEEMENRYRKMSQLGVRNILTYNAKMDKGNEEEKFPFIVLIIDEIADLMLTAGKEIELYVQRLAQMGRACGIHIIIATQRPSVDVITGTIKANFPTRISFKLASKIDSRTILGDLSGAEQLLGAGDMLFLSTSGKLQRIHGSFVSEEDVIAVVDFWKQQGKPKYIELQEEQSNDNNNFDASQEPYYKQAIELIRSSQKVSTSFLQRNFPIGYNRAAKIIEQMEKDGIISKGDRFGRNREIF